MISEFNASPQFNKGYSSVVEEDWDQLQRIASTSIVPEKLHLTGSGNVKHSLGLSTVNDAVDISEIPIIPYETENIQCSSLPIMEYNDLDVPLAPQDLIVHESSQCDLSSVVIGSSSCMDPSEDIDSPYSDLDLSYLSDIPGVDVSPPDNDLN